MEQRPEILETIRNAPGPALCVLLKSSQVWGKSACGTVQHKENELEGSSRHLVTPTMPPCHLHKGCLHQLQIGTMPSLLFFPWKPVFPDAPSLLKIS